jgi:C-terminal processing protease CtpA/Prc
LQKRSEVEIDIILSPKQAKSFRDRINRDGSDAHAIDEALAHVHSENAEASVQADLDAIRSLIQQYSGGFGTLNDTVRQYLRLWFVSQGGVKVVARARANPSSRSAGISSTQSGARYSSEERVLPQSQTIAETSFAGGGPGSLSISRRDGEPWGMGVKPDPMWGVVVTKIKPGGAAARHNLEVGSTFTKIDGTDALRIDKAKLMHMLKTKTTITVELGPVIQNIGDHRAGVRVRVRVRVNPNP